MKKRAISFVLILVLLAMLLPGGSFGGTEVYAAGKTVRSISVKAKPVKLKYRVGEKLSTRGLKIAVRYSGNSRKTLSGGFTCSPTRLTKAGTQKITVKYKGKKTSFTVRVSKAAAKTSSAGRRNAKDVKKPNYKSPYYIVVYTGSQSAVVYGKDKNGAYNVQVKAFTVSTGKKSTPTAKGLYRIRAKYRWKTLMGPCYGQYCSSISPHYLFHSVPYYHKTTNSLYNNSYNNLGRAVSHGCIRMCVRDSKWIYDNCPVGTQVHVVWKSGPKGAGVPKRSSDKKFLGWDPSDRWAKGNPYFKLPRTVGDALGTKATAGRTTATSAVTQTTSPSSSSPGTAATTAEPSTTDSTAPSTAQPTTGSTTAGSQTDETQQTAAG